MKTKITTPQMEVAVANHFNYRTNLIVPNICWGMHLHECDLLIVSQAGYLTEVEIKVTRADLRADYKKTHGHFSPRIKNLYFAIPDYLDHCQQLIPERAGIIIVRANKFVVNEPMCRRVRLPKPQKTKKVTREERYQIARLGALRIWNLKRKLL